MIMSCLVLSMDSASSWEFSRVRKQPIIALYFESETVLKFYNLGTWSYSKTMLSVSHNAIVT